MESGFAPPAMLALAAIAEFGGGIAWVLGLLTPLASLGIACVMATAFYMHTFMRGDPFVSNSMPPVLSSEPAAIYFCVALVLLTIGPGRFSLDARLFSGKRRVPVEITPAEG